MNTPQIPRNPALNLPMFGGRATLQLWIRDYMTAKEFRMMLDALEVLADVIATEDVAGSEEPKESGQGDRESV